MKALVVYDSFFGNTEKIAQAIARGLGAAEEVALAHVGSQTPQQLAEATLLVVGSPTRGFRASEATTAFLTGLPAGSLKGKKVAACDTRLTMESMGSVIRFFFWIKIGKFAAPSMAEALQKAGGELALPPEGFIVKASEGPLAEGELERAEAWGKLLHR